MSGTCTWLGNTSANAGHQERPGCSTRTPESKGLCSTTPASPGSWAANQHCAARGGRGQCVQARAHPWPTHAPTHDARTVGPEPTLWP